MLKKLLFASVSVVGLFACQSNPDRYTSNEPIVEVPFTEVHLTDNFWAPRIEVNRTVSIPSAFKRTFR